MKYLVYREGSGRQLKKYQVLINNNPCIVYNFAVEVLGPYFGDEYAGMDSTDAMVVAKSFVEHYEGFSIVDE